MKIEAACKNCKKLLESEYLEMSDDKWLDDTYHVIGEIECGCGCLNRVRVIIDIKVIVEKTN